MKMNNVLECDLKITRGQTSETPEECQVRCVDTTKSRYEYSLENRGRTVATSIQCFLCIYHQILFTLHRLKVLHPSHHNKTLHNT